MLLSPKPSTSSPASADTSPPHPSDCRPKRAVAAMRADLDAWEAADRDPMGYDDTVTTLARHYARLVKVPVDRRSRIAIADLDDRVGRRRRRSRRAPRSSASRVTSPRSCSRSCSRAVSPCAAFLSRRSRNRSPTRPGSVAFSFVQSANGKVADVAAVLEAAAAPRRAHLLRHARRRPACTRSTRASSTSPRATPTSGCARRAASRFMTLNERADALLTPDPGGLVRGRRRRLAEHLRPDDEPRRRRAALRRVAGLAGLDRRRAGDRALRGARHRRGVGAHQLARRRALRRPRHPAAASGDRHVARRDRAAT